MPSFLNKYNNFSGISFEFHYREGIENPLDAPARSDRQIALDLLYRSGSSPSLLVIITRWLRDLIREAHHIRADIQQNWQELKHEVNRPFNTAEEASAWLDEIIEVWETELKRIEGASRRQEP